MKKDNKAKGLNFGSPHKREAVQNDRRIQELAVYQLTDGLTIPMKNFQDVLPIFAQFKGLIKRGSFTLEQLEDMVMGRLGVVDAPKWYEDIEFLDKEPEKNYKENK